MGVGLGVKGWGRGFHMSQCPKILEKSYRHFRISPSMFTYYKIKREITCFHRTCVP